MTAPMLPTPARFAPADLARPRTRWSDVTATLADFAIVTYAVDPARLAAVLPPGFAPEVFTLRDGARRALVSAVPFRDQDFRVGFAPWLRFTFGQTNYRAYVTHRGRRCAWFFGTTLDTRWVWIPRYAWRLPWHRVREMTFDARWDGERCERYRMRARGAWGAAELELEGTGEPAGVLDGFDDEEATAVVLTHPLVGYFRRRDGVVGTYSVWHDRLALERAAVRTARFEVFERLGLVAPGDAPHSALVQRATEFLVFLPPARVRDADGG